MAGHSLGEYTALVCAGALDFDAAVDLVAARGRYMQEAVPAGDGAMAAVLGLSDDAVAEVCAAAADGDVVAPVNFNAPGQVVIAGHGRAVARAAAAARAAGAKKVVDLPVSVPSHCALMAPAAERLAARLESVPLRAPRIPVVHNVDLARHDDPEAIRAALVRQLSSPVRWAETVTGMRSEGLGALVEMGPGKVLAGLARRIDRSLPAFPVHDPETLEAARAGLPREEAP
jgi:[acyl-carrier-protein] S-malonyltransferase